MFPRVESRAKRKPSQLHIYHSNFRIIYNADVSAHGSMGLLTDFDFLHGLPKSARKRIPRHLEASDVATAHSHDVCRPALSLEGLERQGSSPGKPSGSDLGSPSSWT